MKLKFIISFFICALTATVSFASDVVIKFNGQKAKAESASKSVIVKVNGSHVELIDTINTEPLSIIVSGSSGDGSLYVNSNNKTIISFNSLNLTSAEGAPIVVKNKKKVKFVAEKGTENTLQITACADTAAHKASVIWVKDKAEFAGEGTLNIRATGTGCKGINVSGNITISDLALNVSTTGMYLAKDTTNAFGFPPDMNGMPPFGEGGFDPNNIPEEVKKQFEEMMKNMPGGMPPFGQGMPGGGMPPFGQGMPSGMPQFGQGMPDFGGEGFPEGGMAFKQKYIGTTKGIKSLGIVTIESGKVNVTTTAPGAEGIEGKKGVVVNGGTVFVKSTDDAINANATIYFNGGNVTAWSTNNDAVDANVEGGFPMFFMPNNNSSKETSPGIVIAGGVVNAFSQLGPPEEGFDCDFAPINITAGTAFSIGAGMGEMPSIPTEESAKQPTVLFCGLSFDEGSKVEITNASGDVLLTMNAPFSFKNSSSLVTSPKFKIGESYVLKTGDKTHNFKIEKQFNVVR